MTAAARSSARDATWMARAARATGTAPATFAPAVCGLLALVALASPASAPGAELSLEVVAHDLSRPVDLAQPAGDPRLFVVEQTGRIWTFRAGRLTSPPFLDISGRVSHGNEQGLLGLAFHPRFRENGLLFVNYTDRRGTTRIVRFRAPPGRGAVDPASETPILTVPQPFSNHNGGQLLFGPDGMLYVPLGDGGSAGDPHGNAQNLGTLLGKILRLDVDHGTPYAIPPGNPFVRRSGARPEIWAWGLRNPWRIAFDPAGRTLYVADVGQDQWEEIDIAPAGRAGINYGWNAWEGAHRFDRDTPVPPSSWPPALEYPHPEGCAVIGGRVYRGSVAALRGLYFYGDACSGWIASFRERGGRATERTRWRLRESVTPAAFGEDSAGELYVLDLRGRVLRITGVH